MNVFQNAESKIVLTRQIQSPKLQRKIYKINPFLNKLKIIFYSKNNKISIRLIK